MLTASEVASKAGVSTRAIQLAATEGRLAHTRIGKRMLFTPEAVEEFLQARPAPRRTPRPAEYNLERSEAVEAQLSLELIALRQRERELELEIAQLRTMLQVRDQLLQSLQAQLEASTNASRALINQLPT
jgi:excisionase family DNA binding protein